MSEPIEEVVEETVVEETVETPVVAETVETPVVAEVVAEEVIPDESKDVAVEALRIVYADKLVALQGKVSPANLAKLGAGITTDVLSTLIFSKDVAALVDTFLGVLSESAPIVATPGDTLPDPAKSQADPVGDFVKEEFGTD